MAESSAPGNLDPRATASAAAPEAAAARPADLAALLSRQIAALVETTGASRVAAWGRGADGVPGVLAARVEGAELRPPSEAAWRALAALAGPTDLASASDPELVKLAGEYGFAAAAPLRGEAGEPLAVLLLGTDGAAGHARPRLLAALASAVAKSLRPAAAAARARTPGPARRRGAAHRPPRRGRRPARRDRARDPQPAGLDQDLPAPARRGRGRARRVPRGRDRGAAPHRAPARGREPARAAALGAERRGLRRDRARGALGRAARCTARGGTARPRSRRSWPARSRPCESPATRCGRSC
jgi:hypothetical protein